MEGRLRILLLAALAAFSLWSGAALAAEGESQPQVIQPEIDRREIGLDKIDTEDFELEAFTGLLSVEDFGANAVFGARAAYHISEGLFFEATYAQSTTTETSYERLSGSTKLLTPSQRELSYYNLSLGYNLLPGEVFIGRNWAFNTELYIIGGVGSTHFAGDDRLTTNFGAGFRFLATDWLALHLDVRDHMFEIDLLGSNKLSHNLEFTGGVSAFF
jgi:outer membrane beta-barrel protein